MPAQKCPKCAQELPPELPPDTCPHCLIDFALRDSDSADFLDQGTVTFGDYELLEEIAHGGMGIVYKARQRSLGRLVAIKMIIAGQFAGKQAAQRLRAEATAAGLLQHPNIVAIHEVGMLENQPYFSMDLVDGQNLTQLVGAQPLSPKRAAHYVKTIAEAIHYAHTQGILHRDLKPSNILIDSATDQPRITDFGLAKRLDSASPLSTIHSSLTLTGQVLGSPHFMPPEQADPTRAKIGRETDVFGLGALLYYLLTARAPFQGETLEHTIHLVLNSEPPAPRLLNSSIPRDLETICLKCLEKNPTKRYPTAQALADDLQRYLNNEPISARPIGPTGKVIRWSQRNRALATAYSLLLLLLLLLLLGSPLAIYRINQARKSAVAARLHAELARRQVKIRAYPSEMLMAQRTWNEGNFARTKQLLRNQIPDEGELDLRGFEWRYMWNLCRDESLLSVRLPSDDAVWSLVGTPAHTFAAAASDKTIRLFDPSSGHELGRLSFPNSESRETWHSMALAAKATNLLAAHRADGFITIWDIGAKEQRLNFRAFTNNVSALALSPDGRLLAATGRNMLRLWRLALAPQLTAQPVWTFSANEEGLSGVCFSPDGKTVIAAKGFSQSSLGAWDADTGRDLASFPPISAGLVPSLAFSPDGSVLAASGTEGRINIVDVKTRSISFFFDGHAGSVLSLVFSTDGHRLISAAEDATIRIWDLDARKPLGLWRNPHGSALLAVLAPDGKTILSTCREELKIWSAEPREPETTIETKTDWGSPLVSPNNKWLILTDGRVQDSELNGAQVWHLPSRLQRFHLTSRFKEPLGAAFSSDNRFFALGDVDKGGIALWDTSTWESQLLSASPFAYLETGFEAGSLAFSPDGKVLAAAGICYDPRHPSRATNRLAFWEVGSWEKLSLLPEAGAGSSDRAAAASVAFSHNGELLAVGYRDGWARLWNFRQQRLVKALKRHEDIHYGVLVEFSKDDRWLASLAKGSSTVALFDLSDPEHPREVQTFTPSSAVTWSIEFAPDGKSLMTHSNNGLINFWTVPTLNLALTLRHGHGPGGFTTFAPAGDLLVSKDGLGTVKFWPAPPPTRILDQP